MKRIGRHVLDAVALLSFLLFLVTAATWVYAARLTSSMDFTWSRPACHVDLRVRDDVFLHVSRQSTRVVGQHVVLRHVEVPGLWYDHELLNNAPAGSVDWYVADVRYWLACVAFGSCPPGAAGPPGEVACAGGGVRRRLTPARPAGTTSARCRRGAPSAGRRRIGRIKLNAKTPRRQGRTAKGRGVCMWVSHRGPPSCVWSAVRTLHVSPVRA